MQNRQSLILTILFISNILLASLQYADSLYFCLFGQVSASDYASFYTGWGMIREGLWNQVYTIDGQVAYQLQVFGNQAPLYVHPPHSAVPFLGLSLLPLSMSSLVWMAIKYVCFATLIWQLWSEFVRYWQPFEQKGFLVLCLAFPAVPIDLSLGNIALVMCLIMLNLLLQMRRGNIWWVGVLLFLGSIKYQLFIVLGLYLLGARWWKSLAIGVGLMILAWLTTSLVMGWDIWTGYVLFMQEFSYFWGDYAITPLDSFNLRGLLAFIFGQASFGLINLLSLIMLAGCGIVAFVLGRATWPIHYRWGVAFVITIALYSSPHLYIQDLTFLIVAATFLYDYLRTTSYNLTPLYIALFFIPWVLSITWFIGNSNQSNLTVMRSLFLIPILGYIWFQRPKTLGIVEGPS